MANVNRNQQPLYLDHEKAEILTDLSRITRLSKQTLLREAVDDLIDKHWDELKTAWTRTRNQYGQPLSVARRRTKPKRTSE